MNDYFDIKRENELIVTGTHFWCEACSVDVPVSDCSPDSRYCLRCYNFLLQEAGLTSAKHSQQPSWLPHITNQKNGVGKSPPRQLPIGQEKEVLLPIKDTTSQIYQNLTENRPIPNVGGRPKKDTPVKLIKELSEKGIGVKRIAKELQGQGISLSAMTISRVLSGERK